MRSPSSAACTSTLPNIKRRTNSFRGFSGNITPNTHTPRINASDSINHRYDKNFSGIHDKFKAAQLHLERLKNYKKEIKNVKRNPPTFDNRSQSMAPEY